MVGTDGGDTGAKLTQLRDYVAANVRELASIEAGDCVRFTTLFGKHSNICPEVTSFFNFLCHKGKHFTNAQRNHYEETLAILQKYSVMNPSLCLPAILTFRGLTIP